MTAIRIGPYSFYGLIQINQNNQRKYEKKNYPKKFHSTKNNKVYTVDHFLKWYSQYLATLKQTN